MPGTIADGAPQARQSIRRNRILSFEFGNPNWVRSAHGAPADRLRFAPVIGWPPRVGRTPPWGPGRGRCAAGNGTGAPRCAQAQPTMIVLRQTVTPMEMASFRAATRPPLGSFRASSAGLATLPRRRTRPRDVPESEGVATGWPGPARCAPERWGTHGTSLVIARSCVNRPGFVPRTSRRPTGFVSRGRRGRGASSPVGRGAIGRGGAAVPFRSRDEEGSPVVRGDSGASAGTGAPRKGGRRGRPIGPSPIRSWPGPISVTQTGQGEESDGRSRFRRPSGA